jgi:hypothetical protein
MDEIWFPLNNVPLKIVAKAVAIEVVKFTSVEKGKNVTPAACHSASDVFITPFVIFNGSRCSRRYKPM